jgi:hypothetical protein
MQPYVRIAPAGLRSPGKGANRTPPERAARFLPQDDGGRAARRRRALWHPAVHSVGGLTGKTGDDCCDDHVFG